MSFLSDLFDPTGLFDGGVGNFINNAFNPIGGLADQQGWDLGPISDWHEQSTNYLEDLSDFENFQLEGWGKRFANNPFQFLVAGTPLSTKAWNAVLDKDWDPAINQFGGPAKETYQAAENEGIDTSNSAGSHAVAQTIASYLGTAGLGDLAGGAAGAGAESAAAGSALEAGASGTEALAAADAWGGAASNLASGAAAGAAYGGANALNNDSNLWEGIGEGALGGALAGGFDYGGAMGLDNPAYRRIANQTIGGAVQGAGKNSEAVGRGALQGFIGSALPVAAQQGGSMLNDMFSSNSSGSDWDATAGGGFGGTATANQGQTGYSPAGFLGYNNNTGAFNPNTTPEMYQPGMQMSTPVDMQRKQNTPAPASSPVEQFMAAMMGSPKTAGAPATPGYGAVASNLLGLYQANQQRKQMKDQMQQQDSLNNLFTPNSPYAQQMRQELSRKDAAGGRRSQYGPREAQMMAALAGKNADMQAQMAPHRMALSNAMSENQRRMINNGIQGLGNLYQQAPRMQQDWSSLMNMFGGR